MNKSLIWKVYEWRIVSDQWIMNTWSKVNEFLMNEWL